MGVITSTSKTGNVTIDSSVIRKLNHKASSSSTTATINGVQETTGTYYVDAAPPKTSNVSTTYTRKVVWAIPTSLTKAKPEFYVWFNNDWTELTGVIEYNDGATKIDNVTRGVTVKGANNEAGIPYIVYTYTTADGYFSAEGKYKIVVN
jgi:hypothetical protein